MSVKFSTDFTSKESRELFLIAEIGINHNGSLDIAKKLIDEASEAGFDAVKFQKRDVESCYTEEFLSKTRESPWGNTQRDQKMGLEFSEEDYEEINQYCSKRGILWTASPWDMKSVKFLDKYNLDFVKVPSAKITDIDLLKSVGERDWFIFLSTGMSTIEEIDKAVSILEKSKNGYQLMHCNSSYPMDDEDANMLMIKTLEERYGKPVGYSGHEKTLLKVCITAAAIGAKSIERHITLDRTMYGSDQAASIEVGALSTFVKTIRKIPNILGDGIKDITSKEQIIRNKLVG